MHLGGAFLRNYPEHTSTVLARPTIVCYHKAGGISGTVLSESHQNH